MEGVEWGEGSGGKWGDWGEWSTTQRVDCLDQLLDVKCISRESNPGHIDGNDVRCH